MAEVHKEEKASAKKMNMPNNFAGKRETLKKFIQDVILYLLANEEIYKTDRDKIIFALSFFEEGDAASWKEQLSVWKSGPVWSGLSASTAEGIWELEYCSADCGDHCGDHCSGIFRENLPHHHQ